MLRSAVTFAVMTLVILVPAAFAQNVPLESISDIAFNFGNPGARSLGMGGAFVALADDASAAEANPAGLTVLALPEISAEIRKIETSQTFLQSNSGGDQYATFSNDGVDLAFGSFVYPRGNFVASVYYHKPLVQENSTSQVFQNVSVGNLELTPFTNDLSVELETLGLAFALKAGRFSIGAGARHQTLSESAVTVRDLASAGIQQTVSQTSDDNDLTFSIGAKMEAIPGRFNIGAVYKQGASFEAPVSLVTTGDNVSSRTSAATFDIPDVIGAGIAFRPLADTPWWILADVNKITYSDLASNVIMPDGTATDDFEVEDGTEIRVGTEYTFRTSIPFALRAGYWIDPAHSFEYRGSGTTAADLSSALLFPSGVDDEDHLSFGVGINWTKFQVHAAFDTSDSGDTGAISAVLQF